MGKNSGHSRVSGRRLTAIALSCVVVLAAATAVAVASKGVTKNTNISFPPDTKQTANTSCPAKTHISGGGFQVSPGGTPGGNVESFTTNSNFIGGKSWSVTSGATAASTRPGPSPPPRGASASGTAGSP